MLRDVLSNFNEAKSDPDCKVIIFTGTGDYFCAGVNLAGALKITVCKQHKLCNYQTCCIDDCQFSLPGTKSSIKRN